MVDDAAELRGTTRAERIALTSGADAWHTVGVDSAGIPPLRVSDGPNGARGVQAPGETSACFPVGVALGATWDPELLEQVGAALAQEARDKGAGVLLAPTVNLQRLPLAGRNFECFAEDPHLTARATVAYIRGLQSGGVGACVKHFVANETEEARYWMSSQVDERTLREVYLQPFEAAVREAGAWSIMTAYNRINDVFASDHHELLQQVLREEWGFDGTVVSDWGGTRSTAAALVAGLDLEMPGPTQQRGTRLAAALEAGEVTDAQLDRAAANVVRLARRAEAARADHAEDPRIDVDALAELVARRSIVLLRNDGTLPLDPDALRRVAVVGPFADRARIQGGGSSAVVPRSHLGPADVLRVRLGPDVDVVVEAGGSIRRYCRPLGRRLLRTPEGEPGVRVELFEGGDLDADPAVVSRGDALFLRLFGGVEGIEDPDRVGARLRGTCTPVVDGLHTLGMASAGSARLFVDGREVLHTDSAQGTAETFYAWGTAEQRVQVELRAGVAVELEVRFQRPPGTPFAGVMVGLDPPPDDRAFDAAVAAAADAEVAVVVVGLDDTWETEGHDRVGLSLPGEQDRLVSAVAAVNDRTIVVVNAGSPVAMPWLDEVGAVLTMWYPGQGGGPALASLLLGDESPSGRLPVTFPAVLPAWLERGDARDATGALAYTEGLDIGHRRANAARPAPMFPFGHGLTYTSFELGPVECSAVELTDPDHDHVELRVTVTNTGARRGAEVVQLYLSHPGASVERTPLELRGFRRVELEAGASTEVVLPVGFADLARWDPATHSWRVDPGVVRARVASSSADPGHEVELHVLEGAERSAARGRTD